MSAYQNNQLNSFNCLISDLQGKRRKANIDLDRMSLDCGKKPGVIAIDGMRRCRVLLGHSSTIPLDLRLLSQVEVLPYPI